jgi:putative hydrolase of the HAD superfamily
MNWVVFDYGEVLSRPNANLPKLAATLGAPLGDFERAYWPARQRWDAGCGDLEYWRSVGDALGLPVDEAKADELTEIDVEGWGHLDPSAKALVEELSAAGRPLALLSNAPVGFARWVRAQDWVRHFRVTLFSGDFGCVKPDAEIFRILLGRLGAAPGDCVFFDDRQSNVDGARAVGIEAYRWDGAEHARARLF